jgi:HK97 family phage major capsid protein
MSEEIKKLRDEAKAALEAINAKTEEFAKKGEDVISKAEFDKATAEFDAKYEAWEAKLKAAEEASKKADERADQLEARIAKMRPANGEAKGRDALSDQERKHLDAFESFVRKGDTSGYEAALQDAPAHIKRLTTDDMAQGGYLVAPEFIDAEVSRIVSETSPVRQFASVQVISGTDAFKKNVNVGGSAATWEDQDTDASSENTNPSFREIRIPINGLRAIYHASPNTIDDARVSIEQLFAQEMAIAISETENPTFVSGNGVGKPRGFLSYTKTLSASYTGAWESVETFITGADGAFKAAGSGPEEVFVDCIHSLKAPYSPNARFYMNRSTLAAVRKIRDADGRPLFEWGGNMPASIAGEPYTIFQDMPDIASDSYSIAYGDLRAAYQIVDRAGLTVLRDPFSSKPNVEFFGRKRLGGGMKMFEALKLIQFAD